MNANSTQQEILLIVNTDFFSRQWAKINEPENNFSKKEQLMEACWNGMAQEMLPEFFERNEEKAIMLCEINDADAFIELEFGEYMQSKDKEFSVNPYEFLQVQGFN